MAAISVADLRTAWYARVLGAYSGLRESLEPYEFIRNAAHSPVHLEYAIGIPSTAHAEGRQKPAEGSIASSEVRVLFAWQLSPADSYADLLNAERDIRNYLKVSTAAVWPIDFNVVWIRSDRSAGLQGWIWSESVFQVLHLLPLQ